MNNHQLAIVYNKFCPYAQRALLTAIEKDLPAEFITTGLGEHTKTQFFHSTYAKSLGRDPKSLGKVPILIHKDKCIAESELVCWYMAEEFTSGSQLIPSDAFARTKMRVWISQINGQMISLFDRAKLKQVGKLEQFLKEVESFLEKVESSIEGSYLLGDCISLADLMIYPWFERWIIIEHFFGYAIPQRFTKIKRWLTNMSGRKSVMDTKKLTTAKYYIERTEKMMAARL